jgi:hypothetical protein
MVDLLLFQEVIVLVQVFMLDIGLEIMLQIGIFSDCQLVEISCSKFSEFKWLALIFVDFTVIYILILGNTNE